MFFAELKILISVGIEASMVALQMKLRAANGSVAGASRLY